MIISHVETRLERHHRIYSCLLMHVRRSKLLRWESNHDVRLPPTAITSSTEYITLQGAPSSSGIFYHKQLVHPRKQASSTPFLNMSAITQGVKDFLKGSHKPDSTEVCSEVSPEVTKEHVRPQEHTETAEAVDRERHVHHHQVSWSSHPTTESGMT